MPKTELFSSSIVTVEYLPETKVIQHIVHQPVAGNEQTFKEGLYISTQAMQEYNVTKYLADDRKIGKVPDDLVQWGMTDWQKGMIDAGWKYWANVVPEDIAAAGTLVPLINELYKHGLRMMVFTSVEQGLDWLDKIG